MKNKRDMKSNRVHAERAQLYQDIADILTDPPPSEWFRAALRELRLHRPPPELQRAHEALEHAFEIGASSPPLSEHRQLMGQTAAEGGRRELIQRIMNILHLAHLAEQCTQADSTADLQRVEQRQTEFLERRAGQRLIELASLLQRTQWTPFYAAVGVALQELVRHDLELASG